jgi:hypothetical protein
MTRCVVVFRLVGSGIVHAPPGSDPFCHGGAAPVLRYPGLLA